MRKLIKIAAAVLGICIVFFIAATILFATLVNPNHFKSQIGDVVQKQTGRQFAINGDIHLSYFPWLGLQVDQMVLGNAPGFASEAFAKIDQADVRVKLLPLFIGKVRFGTVTLKGVTINLTKNAQGQNNWSDLLGKNKATTTASTRASSSDDTTTAAKAALALTIANIQLHDANINWKDQQAGQQATISHLNFTSNNINFGDEFPLQLNFTVQSNKPALNAYVAFETKATLSPATQQYSFNHTTLNANLFDKKYPDGKLNVAANADISANMAQQSTTIRNLMLKVANLQIQGQLTGKKLSDIPVFEGILTVNSFNPSSFLIAMGNPIKTQDSGALKTAAADAAVQISPKFIKINDLHINFDDTHATGHFNLTDFGKKIFDFDLNVDQINVDRYLPPQNAVTENAPVASKLVKTPTNANNVNAAILPFAMLRGLHGNGGLQIGNLKVSGLSASNVNLQLNADNDVIHFSPIAANLYGGKSNGDITIDMRSQQPKLSINEALQAIQVGNLFQDVANKSKLQVTGTGDLRFNLQTSGQDAKTLTRNLNGNLKFAVTNGSIKNLNLNRALQTALSAINKTSDDKADSNTDNDTSFSSFTGTAVITNGIATNNDLSLKSNSLEMSGNGTANLIDQSFNYHLKVIALGSPFGRDVIDFQQRIGGSFPLLLTGNFNNPKILPDLSTIGQGLLKGEFRQKLEKTLGISTDGSDNTGANLKDTIRSLRGLIGQ